MAKRPLPTLSEISEHQLAELTEKYGGYPIDIWESRDSIVERDPTRYYGLDIPPYWNDNLWGEMPQELFQRWVMVFWHLRNKSRHPSTKRLSEDFGVPIYFVNSMRSYVAKEAARKLPDDYVGRARVRQAILLEKTIDHCHKKFMGTVDPESYSPDDDNTELSESAKLGYGKLMLQGINQAADLLGLKAPKDPSSISLTQVNVGARKEDDSALASKLGVSSAELRALGDAVAAKLADIQINGRDILEGEFVEEDANG